jgi:hypothetical protein
MKFYKSNSYYGPYLEKILSNKLNAIYSYYSVLFFKNGKEHNPKNAAYISNKIKQFKLNNKFYGDQDDFTKYSWRRFVKLSTFL